jgi:hypothetical protein
VFNGSTGQVATLAPNRRKVYENCLLKVGPDATGWIWRNLQGKFGMFACALLIGVFALSYRATKSDALLDILFVLLALVVLLTAFTLWASAKYVTAASNYLGIDKSTAKRIPLRTQEYERWAQIHLVAPAETQDST